MPHTVNSGGAACSATDAQKDSSVNFIKRIVAGPGDTIYDPAKGTSIRNGKRETDSYIRPCDQAARSATSRRRSRFPPDTGS